MILGIDKGSTYTKSSKGIILKSTVRRCYENEIDLNNDNTVVDLFNNKYIVGNTGNYATDLMKAKHNNTKILVYTAIAESFKEDYIKTKVILGLPIGLYSRNKEQMKKLFIKDPKDKELVEITVNNEKKYILIDQVEVFPEAAGAFYTQDEKNGLVIDIGGLSVDIALFKKGKLSKYSTYSMGTMKLFSKIANSLNSEYDLSLTEWDIRDVLKDGLYIYGKRVDLNIEGEILAHVRQIVERLKLEYDLKMINNVFFTGGGSMMCFDYFKKYIPQGKLMDKSQFNNVKGFEKIGQALFKE
ncbi:MAG: ParM/StbA family protein [Firmicutes bacterium]|nr:ParM/StbA family protein [Bacillota bacterium]